MKRPDVWERFVRRFVRSDMDAQERYTEDVIAHADHVRRQADDLLRSEYVAAERRYRRPARG